MCLLKTISPQQDSINMDCNCYNSAGRWLYQPDLLILKSVNLTIIINAIWSFSMFIFLQDMQCLRLWFDCNIPIEWVCKLYLNSVATSICVVVNRCWELWTEINWVQPLILHTAAHTEGNFLLLIVVTNARSASGLCHERQFFCILMSWLTLTCTSFPNFCHGLDVFCFHLQ